MAVRWLLCVGFFLLFLPDNALAHVKWFADYNLQCPPRSPSEIIFGEYFLTFCLVVGPIMFVSLYIDHEMVRRRSLLFRHAGAVTDWVQPYFPIALRIGVSAFFIAAASYGGFLLTPELKTEADWVPIVHLGIALLVLHPRTASLAGLGMAALYAHAVTKFGIYHLVDYPIFLGVAAYIIIVSLLGEGYAQTAEDVMRWRTGITLLWAGIEKFAFPEWSFGLLTAQPALTFGFGAEFYMVAAGFVEFCCAYLLIAGSFSARVAALVLQFFFVSAIYYFGLIDAIGHSAIIVVLTLLILGQNPLVFRFQTVEPEHFAATHTLLFFAALFLFIGLYCGGHYLSYSPYPDTHDCTL